MKPIEHQALQTILHDDDWALANALELLAHPITDRSKRRLLGGVCAPALKDATTGKHKPFGRLLYLVYGSKQQCAACEGELELVAEGANGKEYYVCCPECDGVGSKYSDAKSLCVNLAGNTVQPFCGTCVDMPLGAARAVVDSETTQLLTEQAA